MDAMGATSARTTRESQSISRIVPKHRARLETIPIWPALIKVDEARAKMNEALYRGDAGEGLYWSQILQRCAPGDLEARECELRCSLMIEDLFVDWLGGYDRIPTRLPTDDEPPPYEADPADAFILQAADGHATIRDLATFGPVPPLALLKSLYALVHAGRILVTDA